MEPFSKDDPLHNLLGKARPVTPRPNFTQNVLRAVRHEKQEKAHWWSICLEWLSASPTPKFAIATLTLLLTAGILFWQSPENTPLAEASPEIAPTTVSPQDALLAATNSASNINNDAEQVVESELESMDQMNDLLANQDTDSFTDYQIAMFLYQ